MGKKKNKKNIFTQNTLQYILDISCLLNNRKETKKKYELPKSTKLYDITKHIESETKPYSFLIKTLVNKHILVSNNHQIRLPTEVKKKICKKCKNIRNEAYFKNIDSQNLDSYGINKLNEFFGKIKYEKKFNERTVHRCVCGSIKSYSFPKTNTPTRSK